MNLAAFNFSVIAEFKLLVSLRPNDDCSNGNVVECLADDIMWNADC